MADLKQVENLTRSLMDSYDLQKWEFKWMRVNHRTFGRCRSGIPDSAGKAQSGVIFMNPLLCTTNTIERCKATILHEIAHAVVGAWNQHNGIWVRQMQVMGLEPKPCFQWGEHDTTRPPVFGRERIAASNAIKSKIDYRITSKLDLSDL